MNGEAVEEPRQTTLNWLSKFSDSLITKDADAAASLFLSEGWLKDSLVFGWEARSLEGPARIASYLQEVLPGTQIGPLVLDDNSGVPVSKYKAPDYSGREGVEFSFTFETPLLRARGLSRLIPDGNGLLKAITVFLEAVDIKGHEELGHELGLYEGHTKSWGEVKAQRDAAEEADPQVLIVGGGQSGLQVAARFRQMNILTIVIEKFARVGDVWRKRYPMLTLHTPRTHHHFLYAPFPRNWPTFTPRDKLAAWIEQYAESQDLVVWTSSTIHPGPKYDESSGTWTVIVNRNGSDVVLHPKHIVLSTGLAGEPVMPEIPSSGDFKGTIMHASAYQGGHAFTGQRLLVVGAGNTSADICQDLVARGAKEVTMLQRSATVVVSGALKAKEWAAVFPENVPPEVTDFRAAAMPLGQLRKILIKTNKLSTEFDREMHEALEKKGLKLSDGPDGTGNKILVYERAAGYWIDVGVADMIIDGRVKVRNGVEIDHFVSNGVVFTDGSELEADTVIFATGYHNIRHSARKLFGDEVIDKTKKVWGLNEEGELQGCYCRSGYPGLWYAVGDFFCGRYMSKSLALQIKSEELGLTSLKSLAAVPTGEVMKRLSVGNHGVA